MTIPEYLWLTFYILIVIGGAAGLVYIIRKGIAYWKIPTYIKAHARQESKLLNSILHDIRENGGHWFATPYEINMQRDPHLINDVKNMAVLIGSKDEVTIKMNLKAAHKYRETAEETIAIHIKGAHVVGFIQRAHALIDTRGKELSFIEDMLNRRL